VALDEEERLLRAVALENAKSVLQARQRAEEALRQASRQLERRTEELRATLESTWDGIAVTDEQGRLTDCNRRYAEMWGIPPEVLAARDHAQLLECTGRFFADPAAFVARVREIEAAAPDESFDVLELSGGQVFERYSRPQVVEGRPAGRVWSFRDVTAYRRAEEALREETRSLELLNRTGTALSSSLDLHALVQEVTDAGRQLSGAAFGAFFYNSGEAETAAYDLYALSGARPEDFAALGRPRATELFGPTFRGDAVIRSDDVRADPRYGRAAPHLGMPPGHLPVRSYLAVPVVSRAGQVIGGLFYGHPQPGVFSERAERMVVAVAAHAAVAIDNARLFEALQRAADERKALLESERYARGEAERASAMKDEFLATLSHELRTPLSAILGWSHILRARSLGEADLRQGLEVIERNARVQTQLIEDLLDMSRIMSGKMRLDVELVLPIACVEAAIETVRPSADAKGIWLHARLDPAAGPVSGDPNRLQQVAWNLLSNAIKFTERGGRVEVVLRRLESQVEITVSDTGAGIKREFLPHVFERFRQGDGTATRTAWGLGLGLAIVKHLVEQHGGTVHAASEGPGAARPSRSACRWPR
jgi:PAS domain S-box-containing protein